MSRIRSIHPGLATDDDFMQMSMACKAAWPLIWTQCDDYGIFEWKPVTLKARLFPADNIDFNSILSELVKLGRVMSYEANGARYGVVRNFCKFQRPKSPKSLYPYSREVRNFAASGSPPGGTTAPVKRDKFASSSEHPSQMEVEEDAIQEDRIPTSLVGGSSYNQTGRALPSVGPAAADNVAVLSVGGRR